LPHFTIVLRDPEEPGIRHPGAAKPAAFRHLPPKTGDVLLARRKPTNVTREFFNRLDLPIGSPGPYAREATLSFLVEMLRPDGEAMVAISDGGGLAVRKHRDMGTSSLLHQMKTMWA